MRCFGTSASGIVGQRSAAPTRAARLSPVQAKLLALQQSVGNRAVTRALQDLPAVQRCGPVACDCPAEERAQQESPPASARPVQRRIGDGHDLTSPRFARDPQLEACYDDEARLTIGATGLAVSAVQSALAELGYNLGPTGVDGRYGRGTWDAVKAFKRDQVLGWEHLGDVGPGTMGRLDLLFARRGGADRELPMCPSRSTEDVVPVALHGGVTGPAGLHIPGITCRVAPPRGLEPPPLATGPMITLITIDLAKQRLTATLSNGTEKHHVVSTGRGLCGRHGGNPCRHPVRASNDHCTPPGNDYEVQSRHGKDWHGWDGNNEPQHHMAYYVGFLDGRGIGIHNSQHADGTPRSLGCVRLGMDFSEGSFAFWLNTHVQVNKTKIHVTDTVAPATEHECPSPKPKRKDSR